MLRPLEFRNQKGSFMPIPSNSRKWMAVKRPGYASHEWRFYLYWVTDWCLHRINVPTLVITNSNFHGFYIHSILPVNGLNVSWSVSRTVILNVATTSESAWFAVWAFSNCIWRWRSLGLEKCAQTKWSSSGKECTTDRHSRNLKLYMSTYKWYEFISTTPNKNISTFTY